MNWQDIVAAIFISIIATLLCGWVLIELINHVLVLHVLVTK